MVMEPECATKPAGPGGWPLGVNGRHILFTNYEGVDMQPGGTPGNSFENVGLRAMDLAGKGVIALPPYDPDNPKRLDNILAIHKLVSKWYADMNVDVVISRPLSGDYLMSVVGGRQSDIVQKAGVVGISPLDCSNRTEANLNYAFSGSLSEDPEQVAVTIAHEAGHAYGLVHTDNDKDIMFPSVQTPSDIGFATGEAADPGVCNVMQGYVQDGKKILTENLGARPDNAKIAQGKQPAVVDARSQTDFILQRTDSVMEMGYIKKKPGRDAIDWTLLEAVIKENPDLYGKLKFKSA